MFTTLPRGHCGSGMMGRVNDVFLTFSFSPFCHLWYLRVYGVILVLDPYYVKHLLHPPDSARFLPRSLAAAAAAATPVAPCILEETKTLQGSIISFSIFLPSKRGGVQVSTEVK